MSEGGFRTADYDFDLPRALIAQHPAALRDESRLLIVDRRDGRLAHARFRDLASLVPRGDALVVNTSRVLKARLLGTREGGGAAEVFLLAPRPDGSWEALVRPGARLRPGRRVRIAPDVHVVVGDTLGDDGTRAVRFETSMPVDELLEQHGHLPLPPYIDRPATAADEQRYQTVYARENGSVAAPTAGLHFTPALISALDAGGVTRVEVTLHVGAGTFKPVEHDDPSQHMLHHERFVMPGDAAATLNATRARGSGVWAVGTTSLRVLESVVTDEGRFEARAGSTSLFIRPPWRVRGADHLVTNFHLPRSSLLMLVAAFAGYDLMRHAYAVAVAEGYRFYSYGDAMCIL